MSFPISILYKSPDRHSGCLNGALVVSDNQATSNFADLGTTAIHISPYLVNSSLPSACGSHQHDSVSDLQCLVELDDLFDLCWQDDEVFAGDDSLNLLLQLAVVVLRDGHAREQIL